jgi:hypothetical protein
MPKTRRGQAYCRGLNNIDTAVPASSPLAAVCANELVDGVYRATWVVSSQPVNPDGFPRTGISIMDERDTMNPNSEKRGTDTEGYGECGRREGRERRTGGGGGGASILPKNGQLWWIE